MDIRSKLMDLAAEGLKPGHFLVEVVAAPKHSSKVTIIIDGDNGVTIDDCSELSRVLSSKLDEMDFGTTQYALQVSTPGLDQPLSMKRQYHKNVGRNLKVHKKDKQLVVGKLSASDETGIVLIEEVKEGKKIIQQEAIISFNEIEKAFVMVSFK